MDEYITKENAQLARPEWRCRNDQYDCGWNDCINEYLDMIDTIPAADVAPVIHGKWIVKIDPWDMQHIGKCSECGRTNCNYEYYRFCPQCGAKMDKEE